MIALCGMVIWYLATPHTMWRNAVFVMVYFLVAITSSSIVPKVVKQVIGSELRFSIPLTALWLVILGDLMFARTDRVAVRETG